jgi:hypothetical protein
LLVDLESGELQLTYEEAPSAFAHLDYETRVEECREDYLEA